MDRALTDPERLWEMIRLRLVVIQDSYEDAAAPMQLDEDDSEDGKSDASDASWEDELDLDKCAPLSFALSWSQSLTLGLPALRQPQLDPAARLAAKKADPAFGPLHRSKGFFWLATRPSMSGEWSQAGVMLSISGGGRWLCTQDEDSWPAHPECVCLSPRRLWLALTALLSSVFRALLTPRTFLPRRVREKMKADFRGSWGDRRQELVFIGEQLETIQPLLTAELDACLLNDDEWASWEKIMKVRLSSFEPDSQGKQADDPGGTRQSKKSLARKVEKLEQLFDNGFEDCASPCGCRLPCGTVLTTFAVLQGSTRRRRTRSSTPGTTTDLWVSVSLLVASAVHHSFYLRNGLHLQTLASNLVEPEGHARLVGSELLDVGEHLDVRAEVLEPRGRELLRREVLEEGRGRHAGVLLGVADGGCETPRAAGRELESAGREKERHACKGRVATYGECGWCQKRSRRICNHGEESA